MNFNPPRNPKFQKKRLWESCKLSAIQGSNTELQIKEGTATLDCTTVVE